MKTRIVLIVSAFLLLPFFGSGQREIQGRACRKSPVKSEGMNILIQEQSDKASVSVNTKSGSYIMDFENIPDFSLTFSDWSATDVDQHGTYGIDGYSFLHQTQPMAFLCFNPAQVNPSMASDLAIQPHSGQRFGACFSSNPPSNNDWFISPQIQLDTNGSFTFWIKSYSAVYGLDTYNVAVSTTDNGPNSFTTISGAVPLQTTLAWAKKTFSLSNFNNQKVYVAIQCTSNDHFLMMIDDLEVKTHTDLTADFSADKISVMVGEQVNFSDQSLGNPSSWSWTFTGGTPSVSSLQNPSAISYLTPGIYDVKLKIGGGNASDSITKPGYITVAGYPTSASLDFESCDDFTLSFNPWTVIDVKGGNTYGIQDVVFPNAYSPMAYICFNPSKTVPP
ncbi:MAG: choice-of-anchor J domain-containing protein, partial [Bacteroidota bacterium]